MYARGQFQRLNRLEGNLGDAAVEITAIAAAAVIVQIQLNLLDWTDTAANLVYVGIGAFVILFAVTGIGGKLVVEGVVLATQKDHMRVAAAGIPDAIDLKFSGGQWFAGDRQPVEFDFLMSDQESGESLSSLSKPVGKVRAAGSSQLLD